MSKIDEKLNDFFEVASMDEKAIIPFEPIQHETLDKDLETDYKLIRENFHELIERGKDVMEDILRIAVDSEKARDFEVAAVIMKNVLDANQQLLDVHNKIREIANYKQQKDEKTTNINNAVFVGSASELNKLIRDINTKVIEN